jgi:hypothetical protein
MLMIRSVLTGKRVTLPPESGLVKALAVRQPTWQIFILLCAYKYYIWITILFKSD